MVAVHYVAREGGPEKSGLTVPRPYRIGLNRPVFEHPESVCPRRFVVLAGRLRSLVGRNGSVPVAV